MYAATKGGAVVHLDFGFAPAQRDLAIPLLVGILAPVGVIALTAAACGLAYWRGWIVS